MKHKPIKPQLYGCLNCSPIPSAKLSKKHKREIYGEIRLRIDDKTIGDWLHESPTVKSIEKQYREQIDKGKCVLLDISNPMHGEVYEYNHEDGNWYLVKQNSGWERGGCVSE